MGRKVQFSLRDLFAAMFWLSVGGVSFSLLRSFDYCDYEDWPQHVAVPFVLSMFVLTVSTPFIAIGAVFGRSRTGVVVAGIILFSIVALMSIGQ